LSFIDITNTSIFVYGKTINKKEASLNITFFLKRKSLKMVHLKFYSPASSKKSGSSSPKMSPTVIVVKSPSKSPSKKRRYNKRFPCKKGEVRDTVTHHCRAPKKSGRPKLHKSKSLKSKSTVKRSKRSSKARSPCKAGTTRDKDTKHCRALKKSGRPKKSKSKNTHIFFNSPSKPKSQRKARSPCKKGETRDKDTKHCRAHKKSGRPKLNRSRSPSQGSKRSSKSNKSRVEYIITGLGSSSPRIRRSLSASTVLE